MNLTNKQKQYLKGLAHPLNAVVLLGNNGLTEGVLAEIDLALNHHELIKVKIAVQDRDMRRLIADTIVNHTQSHAIQLLGSILTLYRPSDNKKITLPK